MQDRIAELKALGCETAVSFVPAMWRRADVLLPHWAVDLPTRVLEQADEIRRCAGLFSDERSQQEYLAQIRWRLFGDFSVLPAAVDGPQYFASECFTLLDDEAFVDCGAFDGDTLRVFLEQTGGNFQRAICFEPDPANFERLQRYAASLPATLRGRVETHPLAVGSTEMLAAFGAAGDTSSRLGAGALEVKCVPIDGFLDGSRASFLKFDIEGAEPDGLLGANRTIVKNSPVLAVCAYHAQAHLWQLPLLIDQMHPGYCHFLRPYKQVWELVCYAVPPKRVPEIGGRLL